MEERNRATDSALVCLMGRSPLSLAQLPVQMNRMRYPNGCPREYLPSADKSDRLYPDGMWQQIVYPTRDLRKNRPPYLRQLNRRVPGKHGSPSGSGMKTSSCRAALPKETNPLEIKSPGDPIPLSGSSVQFVGNNCSRCYESRLTEPRIVCSCSIARTTSTMVCVFAAMWRRRSTWSTTDRSTASRVRQQHGQKIQMLGDELRLVLFEWTHMPISQQVYAQIAWSVRFRQPPRNLQALTDRIKQVYGIAGFLETGMNRSEVLALLGPPTSEEQGVLRYVFQRQLTARPDPTSRKSLGPFRSKTTCSSACHLSGSKSEICRRSPIRCNGFWRN